MMAFRVRFTSGSLPVSVQGQRFAFFFSATVIFHDDSNGFLVPPTINAQNRLIKNPWLKLNLLSVSAKLPLYDYIKIGS